MMNLLKAAFLLYYAGFKSILTGFTFVIAGNKKFILLSPFNIKQAGTFMGSDTAPHER